MEDSLAALAEMTRGGRSGTTWAEHVSDLADAAGSLLHGNVRHPDGDRRTTPVIQVQPTPGRAPTVVEVAAWRRSDLSEMPGALVSAVVRAAIQQRQNATETDRFALLAVIAGAGDDGVTNAELPSELDDLLSGFDVVAIGLVDNADEWLVLRRGADPEPAPNFESAVAMLMTDPPPPAPRPRQPEPDVVRPPHVLMIAGEWGSRFGGLSTLNRDLATALADAGAEVHVCVPDASPAEVELAARARVNLVAPDPIPGIEGNELLLAGPRIEDDYEPDIIIGHDRFYGPYAYGLQHGRFRRTKPKRVHVVHVNPERLEAAKEDPDGPSRMMVADSRHTVGVRLAVSADLVVGVGPLLSELIEDEMRGYRKQPDVFDLWPGLPDWEPVDAANPPNVRKVLLIARAEDVRSKGIDIAVRALREVTARQPDRDRRPILTIRGVPRDAPEEVRRRVTELAGDVLEVSFHPYTAEEEQIRADRWGSRLAIMPSRHEGFGLAAYEAIAMGVPVLITQESGLARMLTKILGAQPPEVVPVRGGDDEIERYWANAIGAVLLQPGPAFERAAWLRDRIRQEVTWEKAVDGLFRKLGVDPATLAPRRGRAGPRRTAQ